MDIVGYVKAHPVASGLIAVVGVFIFITIAGGGGSSEAAVDSGPSDAEIAANAQIAAAQINAQAATSAASIGAGVQLNSDNKAAEVALAQVNMYNTQIAAQKDVSLATINAQSDALKTAYSAETAKTQTLVGALGNLKKKNRDEALQAIATGQVVQPGWNTGNSAAGIIGALGSSIGNIASGLGSVFSDQRVKENIVYVGQDKRGRDVFDFNYKGSNVIRRGYIAQSLMRTDPDRVFTDPATGYYRVRLPYDG